MVVKHAVYALRRAEAEPTLLGTQGATSCSFSSGGIKMVMRRGPLNPNKFGSCQRGNKDKTVGRAR